MTLEVKYRDDAIDMIYWSHFRSKATAPMAESFDVSYQEMADWVTELDFMVKNDVINVPTAITTLLSAVNSKLSKDERGVES